MYTTAPQNWPGRPCPVPPPTSPQQQDGLQFYTGAAYATYRQNGTLWVTNLRTGETHDTGVSADAPYHICTVGEDIAVVQEQ